MADIWILTLPRLYFFSLCSDFYLYQMFSTPVNPTISSQKITHGDSILAVGSCFAQNIGQQLTDYKFDVNINPFGILFNPHSIFKIVNLAATKGIIESMGIVENHGIFHHYDLHSDMSNMDREQLLDNANEQLHQLGAQLPHTTAIIYTFGTAVVYERKKTGKIVANCHKTPQWEFDRRIMEVEEIVHGFKVHYDLIRGINRKVRFILTVSPVRHQKETFEQNNVSKSVLRIACEKLKNSFDNVEYFPAFEIMMDELRDYRYYAEDMLHPSPVATDYIWNKFTEVYFDEPTKEFVKQWNKIRKALNHRPFNKDSKEHQKFVQKTIGQLQDFKDKIDVAQELTLLKSQLI